MTYTEVVKKIENAKRFGNLSGVETAGRMFRALGNPQTGMRFIHIAGTNGKGSVSAFLCEILKAAGQKTGMFTSPHLVDFAERIRVDGEMIPQEAVVRLGEWLFAQKFSAPLTMFDYCLAIAILYFKEQKCDVMILETGLGGRLDATNAVGVPDVSVITKIGYDHMAVLGDTLPAIAAEKAGIIKQGTALVLESQEESVRAVLLDAAEKAKVRSVRMVEPEKIKDCRYGDGEQVFSYRAYSNLQMRMLGVHQYENAAAAILAAEEFLNSVQSSGAKIADCIVEGISQAHWRGRMEILRKEPFFMVDGAHNSNGVAALKESLMTLFPGEQFHFIMGVMADKDYEEMIEELLPLAVDFKTVTVESDRALQAAELAECIRERGIPAECAKNLRELLAPENGDIEYKTVAFGSLYFIGEIEAIFLLSSATF